MMAKKYLQLLVLVFGANLFCFSTFLHAAYEEIECTTIFVPSHVEKIKLFYGQKAFHVFKDEATYQVKNHLLDRSLRNISKDSAKLKEFLKNGYIDINQDENGDYLLSARDRLQGGGPILGKAFYFIVKAFGHIAGVPEEFTEVAAQSAETVGNATPGP